MIAATQIGGVQYLDDGQLQQAAQRSVALPKFTPGTAGASERELRGQLCGFLRRGCRQRLFISTEGSFSARLGDDTFLITPTQRDRESLALEDLVLVDRGRRESGKKASRAVLAHRAIYRRHPEVQAVVFAHPVHATAFSVTDVPFDRLEVLESTAEAVINARAIGDVSVMPSEVIDELRTAFNLNAPEGETVR